MTGVANDMDIAFLKEKLSVVSKNDLGDIVECVSKVGIIYESILPLLDDNVGMLTRKRRKGGSNKRTMHNTVHTIA